MDKKKRKYRNTKPLSLPVKYEKGFLKKLDARTEIYQLLHSAYKEIVTDLGGEDRLSHVQTCIVERFVFLEAVLRTWELKIVENPKESEAMVSRWIQALNSLSGLAKTIGIERQTKKVVNLRSYIDKNQ